jgi:hypothetical protein
MASHPEMISREAKWKTPPRRVFLKQFIGAHVKNHTKVVNWV